MSDTHMGRKIGRLRELRGMKQEALALALNISQQAVSKMEQCEKLEPEMLDRVANVLGVSAQTIRYFDEKVILELLSNRYSEGKGAQVLSFHPIEKLIELYERLLVCEQEKTNLLLGKCSEGRE